MYRRSIGALAKQAGRTIVRDPRKTAASKSVPANVAQDNQRAAASPSKVQPPTLPFEPSQQNQESIGSSLASYALAGVGVTLGVVLVRVVLGF